MEVPLRVDFGGGWLDVPRLAVPGQYIVNCAISPLVSLTHWPYQSRAGLGGSAAYAILAAKDGVQSELDLGVGWQDPAIITETGLCVWRSGFRPALDCKSNVDMLRGRLALYWTGTPHDTPSNVDNSRNYELIALAGRTARTAVRQQDLNLLATAVRTSYTAQRHEGMAELPEFANQLARKYCGGGWGGYAVYLFAKPEYRDAAVAQNEAVLTVEPYIRTYG